MRDTTFRRNGGRIFFSDAKKCETISFQCMDDKICIPAARRVLYTICWSGGFLQTSMESLSAESAISSIKKRRVPMLEKRCRLIDPIWG